MRRYKVRRNGECLSSIKHVVAFLDQYYGKEIARRIAANPTELPPQREMANNESVRRHLDAFTRRSNYTEVGGRPQCDKPEKTGGRQREKSLYTTHATGRPISRFTVARKDCTVVVCSVTAPLYGVVPLTPAHRRRRSLWCREHRN
ncbi:hypothetical protein TNCV_4177791 [Trichonephila clavipes]|nr:hypothetical protein TNCV_4177791 [Trichonephila clavipes]